jgi:hypothetical protein
MHLKIFRIRIAGKKSKAFNYPTILYLYVLASYMQQSLIFSK